MEVPPAEDSGAEAGCQGSTWATMWFGRNLLYYPCRDVVLGHVSYAMDILGAEKFSRGDLVLYTPLVLLVICGGIVLLGHLLFATRPLMLTFWVESLLLLSFVAIALRLDNVPGKVVAVSLGLAGVRVALSWFSFNLAGRRTMLSEVQQLAYPEEPARRVHENLLILRRRFKLCEAGKVSALISAGLLIAL